MREAARSSVLSRRWKDTWTYTTGSFDFDFKDNHKLFKIVEAERYISKVNKILNAHNGSTIQEFRLKFHLNSTHKSDIDNWIHFAVRKRVERLELRFDPPVNLVKVRPYQCYSFPPLAKLNTITFLTSLKLYYVDVTSDIVEYILSNCALLEKLVVIYAVSLLGVRVVVPCPKLNHLEMSGCHYFKHLHIYSAPNLKSFSYSGPEEARLSFMNVPNLRDVSLTTTYRETLVGRFRQLPVLLSQIEKLCLSFDTTRPRLYDFPELKHVKELELHSEALEDQSLLLPCVSIIQACPNLHRFSLWFEWVGSADEEEQVQQLEKLGVHKKLKEVELVRFRGIKTDVEVATYLLSTAPFLERIIVDVDSLLPDFSAKQCATHLAQQLSPAAELLF